MKASFWRLGVAGLGAGLLAAGVAKAACWKYIELSCCLLVQGYLKHCQNAIGSWPCVGDTTTPPGSNPLHNFWILAGSGDPGYTTTTQFNGSVTCTFYEAFCGTFYGTCVYSTTTTTFACRTFPAPAGDPDCTGS